MSRHSAGLLMYRINDPALEVLLVHPGGPFWASKDAGAWSIPKGELQPGEDPLEAARREFREETGFTPHEPMLELGSVKQSSAKLVTVWAFQGDCDPRDLVSNLVSLEWPPRSGRHLEFAEIDRAQWFSLEQARTRILRGQAPFLDRLGSLLHL